MSKKTNAGSHARNERQVVRGADRPTCGEISSWLQILMPSNRIVQLFVKDYERDAGKSVNLYGYFDDIEKLVHHADRTSGRAKGVYFTLNPLHERLLARCPNELRVAKREQSATNNDVIARELLLVDVDPRRPPGVSSTDEEKVQAAKKAGQVRQFLRDRGWPNPVLVDSGNGFHLIYRVDLPANDSQLVRGVLQTLASRFDDESVQVDTGVFDPIRLCKLPGTMACKGGDTSERPHRFSRVLFAPTQFVCVKTSQLKELTDSLVRQVADSSDCSDAPDWLVRDARKYVEKMPEAIAGQHGHDATFAVACRLVIDFDLSTDDALPVFRAYNERCSPAWSDAELLRKLREAEKQPGARGRLMRQKDLPKDAVRPTHRLAGPRESFHGWIPDFAFFDANHVLVPLADYRKCSSFNAIFRLAVWQQQRSDAVVPDVLLRQCWWGSSFPKNWRATLRKRLSSLPPIETRHPSFRCPTACPCHGAGVRHEHYVCPSGLQHGVLESFAEEELRGGHRKFNIFSKDTERAEWRAGFKKKGRLLSVYWPVLLLGDSPRIKLTGSQQRLLLAITRELTYDKRSPRADRARLVTNGRVPIGRVGAEAVCPLLDASRSYVVFGGNGNAIYRGKGYRILDRGWLRRAGYPRSKRYDEIVRDVSKLVDDLLVLADALDLTIVGRHSGSRTWVAGESMPRMLKTGRGTEVLANSRVCIYAPEDYLSLWRLWFSQRLGFDWIPESRDDPWCDESDDGSHSDLLIGNAEKAREFLGASGLTQEGLATRMECSRERVNRHLNGHRNSRKFFEGISDVAASMLPQ